MTPASRLLLLLLLLLLAVVLSAAGCASSGDGDEGGGTARTGTGAASAPAFPPCLPRSSTVARNLETGSAPVYIVDAEVFASGCTDVVTFEFRAGGAELPPGYEAGYEPGPFRDFTSGDEIDVGGESSLVVRFADVALTEVTPEDPGGTTTYEGRESIEPSGLNHLREARMVAGPEGFVQWVVGLDSERPFVVDASSLPPTIVVTIG